MRTRDDAAALDRSCSPSLSANGPLSRAHVPAFADFADAILQDRDPAITGEDGGRSQELIAAITLSGCRNKQVHLPVDRQEYDDLMEELKVARKLPNA